MIDAATPEIPTTPEGWHGFWKKEIDAAKKDLEKFWANGDKVVDIFRCENAAGEASNLNLFHANISTLRSMLYGQIPKISVNRRHSDANDDLSRVGGEMLQRILNSDVQEEGEDYSAVLRNVLDDRLLPGLGTARLVYDFEKKTVTLPAPTDPITGMQTGPVTQQEVIADEWVDTVYTYWKDVLWSQARYWSELRWRAYRTYLDREELVAKFGEYGADVPLNAKSPLDDKDTARWSKAEVWEIWDKARKKLWWYCEGCTKILGEKEDALGLPDFFPEPPPFTTNCVPGKMIPRSDYVVAEGLYTEIDELQERIELLTDAVKVAGVYDKSFSELQGLLKPGQAQNVLIPVDNWAYFSERGGMKGVVDFMPLEAVVMALDKLIMIQGSKIEQLYQVTGMSDILRGAAVKGATATEQSLKAKFASVRVQAIQDEFARFASDLQRIKAFIICKHFQPTSIIKYSNIMSTPDAQLAPQAAAFLKDTDSAKWRINVQPETLAMVDYSQLQKERTEYISVLGMFLQSAGPIAEKFPQAAPVLLELLKWGLAGFKGSNQIEGVLDHAIVLITQEMGNPKPPEPNPAAEKIQLEMKQSQEEHAQRMQQTQQKFALDSQQAQQEHQLEMSKLVQEFGISLKHMAMEMEKLRVTSNAHKEKAIIDLVAAREKTTEGNENE